MNNFRLANYVSYRNKELNIHTVVSELLNTALIFSGEGSQPSGTSEDTTLSNMARAVQVHPDANSVMYFA